MYSLFTKIFFSFWLVALLLGGALFAADRYLGEGAVNQAVQRTDAHAATLSTLLADQGMSTVRRWLNGMSRGNHPPLFLLDAEGHPLPDQPLPRRLRESQGESWPTGIHPLRPGLLLIVRPVPNTTPPLHLGALVRPEHPPLLPIGWLLLLAAAVSGVVCFALAAIITRPLRHLRVAAQSFAEGELSVRVPVRGRDETAALARDFNTMADRVRDLLEAQQRLLRDVSHELRSPLARLRVALELARKKGDAAAMLERVEREANRLELLVADVLSLARLEAAQTRLPLQPVALDALVNSIVQDAAFEAEAADRRVTGALAADVVVQGDPILLRSAIENVVRNAIRHTAPATAVEVTMEADEERAVVTVRDHGDGVPEPELGRLFEPFTRVGEARDRFTGGYGLGLAISRRAVEAHGGEIRAENIPAGGLLVTLRLPRMKG